VIGYDPLMFFLLAACESATTERPAEGRPRDSHAGSATDTAPEVDGLACGDGLALGTHEECDGADDSACPGSCSAHCQCPSMPPSGELSIHVMDVWQGDGVLVVSPDGFTMLVDAGDEDDYWGIKEHFRDQGIAGLDYTLVSHQHADHMGAMDWALEDHPEAGLAFDGGGRADSNAFSDYRAMAADKRTTVRVGDLLDMGPAITVEVLHADIGDRDNENNNSVVIRITHGEVTALLGGDCESAVCESSFDPGPIDIYKVHHHGSVDSSAPWFLDQMSPSVALISCGEGNDYGHPDGPTLRRLQDAGAEVWRTDEVGHIVARSDGSAFTISGGR